MISRAGTLRTFQMPGSRLSFFAAKSKRAAWAAQGLISCSRVSVEVCGAISVAMWGSFCGIAGISDSPAISVRPLHQMLRWNEDICLPDRSVAKPMEYRLVEE